jgi:subtilisin family serine protease
LVFLALAAWLAVVPLMVTSVLAMVTQTAPGVLVDLGLMAPGQPLLPAWAFGLLSLALTLALDLLVFVPLWLSSRKPGRELVRAAAVLAIAITFYQALVALPGLLWLGGGATPLAKDNLAPAVLRLALILPFLLFGLGWMEAQRHGGSLLQAWRRVGLRLWLNPSAFWLALATSAVIVGPWVLVGSLGSPGTTAANALQALPSALGEEILFRGFAIAWLWRAARKRSWAAAGSLVLFVAAQGGAILPQGDWGAMLRFASALLLGLLLTELTVRAGGSIWPAVIVHFLYEWTRLAFVDPRFDEQVLTWLPLGWAPLAAGGLGLLLWLGRKLVEAGPSRGDLGRPQVDSRTPAGAPTTVGKLAAATTAVLAWAVVVVLYLTLGVPGFHPDGFLIFMEEQADLGQAAAIADPVERRAWSYTTLVETAERSQAPLRAELERRGVAYRPHYVVNMIEVLSRPGLRRAMANEPGVASVVFQPGVRRYPRAFEIPGMDVTGPNGVEWNVAEVGADRVWALGYEGQGVVVGDADTGVEWDHPALKEAYRGWDGSTASHDYHWYDAWDGRAEPWDDNGHGTHTTGTMVGSEGENLVGLAPEADWIACRNMRQGLGTPGSYITCMEFLLAPFPVKGDPFHDGDPAKGAHVVNNSWGCPAKEGCLPDTLHVAIQNLRAAGQLMVVSAGNEGPACSTVDVPPATYDEAFSVGAIRRGDQVASFSNRGPVAVDGSGRLKPDIVAPGVNIRSAVPAGYASLMGTSMAGPHVAGAVALLWSADPSLIGELDHTEELLASTAQPLTTAVACEGAAGSPMEDMFAPSIGGEDLSPVCGCDDEPGSVPNNVYGWGQVDIWEAVRQALRR